MALSTGAKIAIGGAAALAAYFLLAGTSKAATVDPHVAGQSAGCADGKRDALAGQDPLGAADVTGSATITAQANASGDPVAYLDGYMSGYNQCYSANKPAAPVGPSKGPAAKKPTGPSAPPGADKPGAMDAYGKGCFQGAKDGYNDGLGGNSSRPHPSDYASGNPTAFAAGYRRAYSTAYSNGNFGYQAAIDAGFPPDEAASTALGAADPTYPDTVASGCDGYFDGWWSATTGTGGIEGFFQKIEVGGIALVGMRRPRMVVQRLAPQPLGSTACRKGAADGWRYGWDHGDASSMAGTVGSDDYARAFRLASKEAASVVASNPMLPGTPPPIPMDVLNRVLAQCSTLGTVAPHPLGWPAPPPGSSRIYRSY